MTARLVGIAGLGACVLLAGAGACPRSDVLDEAPGTVLRYSAYDQSGQLLHRGLLTLEVDASNRVSGTWRLQDAAGRPARIGCQDGEGRLEGEIRDDQSTPGSLLVADFNPGWADCNYVISAPWRPDAVLQGTWVLSGIEGALDQGTFTTSRP